jgi:hypothetical protein
MNARRTWKWKWKLTAVTLLGCGGALYLYMAPQPERAQAARSPAPAAPRLLPPLPAGGPPPDMPMPGMPMRGAGAPMPGMPMGGMPMRGAGAPMPGMPMRGTGMPTPGMPPLRGRTFAIVDLNLAPLSDLLTLPGMTPDYAQKIIAGRPFRGRDDLERAGIPRDVFERMSPPAMIRYVETGVPRPQADAEPGRFRIGMSPALPHMYVMPVCVLDCQMYQAPVEGRNTAMSVFPSPS